jgi:hypothetical protein
MILESDSSPLISMKTIEAMVAQGIECLQCHCVYFVERAANRSRMYHRNGTWRLLCVCGNQFSFAKRDLNWYQAPATSSESGYAAQGQWKIAHLPRIVLQLALGIARRSASSPTNG